MLSWVVTLQLATPQPCPSAYDQHGKPVFFTWEWVKSQSHQIRQTRCDWHTTSTQEVVASKVASPVLLESGVYFGIQCRGTRLNIAWSEKWTCEKLISKSEWVAHRAYRWCLCDAQKVPRFERIGLPTLYFSMLPRNTSFSIPVVGLCTRACDSWSSIAWPRGRVHTLCVPCPTRRRPNGKCTGPPL